MKKVLFIAAALIAISSVAFAAPPQGYMGLYADAGHSVCSVVNPGGFLPFEMYIYCLPGVNGLYCAEYRISYPGIVIPSTVTQNPLVSVAQGDLSSGMSVCFVQCNVEWTWTHHQTLYLTATTPAWVQIVAHPTVGKYQFANCLPGYPIEDIKILNHLALNQNCIIAVNSTSWGAIKNLYN